MKKILTIMLVLAIVLAMIPTAVFANDTEASAPATAPAATESSASAANAPSSEAAPVSEPASAQPAAEPVPAQTEETAPAQPAEAAPEAEPAAEPQGEAGKTERTETEGTKAEEPKTEETETGETKTEEPKNEEKTEEKTEETQEEASCSVAGHTDHCACGNADLGACTTHVCQTITSWTAINQDNAGNYWKATQLSSTMNLVLTENISVTRALYVGEGGVLNLCLNGYTITVGENRRAFNVYQGGTLNVCDCVGTGKIVTTGASSSGAIISSNGEGKTQPRLINLYGGEFTTTSTAIKCPAITMAYGYTTVNFYGDVKFSNWVNNTTATGNSDLGCVIAMAKSTNVFNMYGGTITGCKMTSTSNGNGGAFYVAGSATCSMYGGLIENCSAANGGAVSVASGKFNMYGGKISGCTALKNGGAVYVNTSSSAQFNFKKGTIENCSAQIGGGVSLTQNAEMTMSDGATITGCKTVSGTIAGNGTAGAILLNSNAKSLKISDSTISDNKATKGSAVAALGGTLELDNVTLTGNTSTNAGQDLIINVPATVKNWTSAIPVAVGGAAKLTLPGTAKIKRQSALTANAEITFTDVPANTVLSAEGDTSFTEADASHVKLTGEGANIVRFVNGTIVAKQMSPSTITFNKAVYSSRPTAADVTVTGSTGAITFAYYSDSECENEISPPSKIGTFWMKASVAADDNYGAATSEAATLVITTIEAHKHCACANADLGACTTHVCEQITQWLEVDRSNASGYWKGTDFTTTLNLVLMEDVTVTKSLCIAAGGVVNLCLNGHTVTVNNASRAFDVNQGGTLNVCDCVGTGKVVTTGACAGGAIIACGSTGTQPRLINLYGGEFTTTAADIASPAITMKGGYATVNFYGSVKFSNWVNNTSATGNSDLGGVIAMAKNTNVFNMYGGTITGCKMTNTSNGNGGAFYVAGSATCNMYGGLIENCEATNGGAVYVASGTFNMAGGKINGCTATKNGGAVYVNSGSSGQFVFAKGTIEKCSAQIGGAVSLTKNGAMTMSDGATITECETVAGSLAGNGTAGAILVNSNAKSLSVSDSTISKCKGKNGGAIAYLGGTLNLTNAVLTENEASANGGAVYVSGAGLQLNASNCSMSKNTAVSGGAIYLSEATAKLNGGTYSENTATTSFGGAIYAADATVTVTGGTYTQNHADTKHGGFAYIIRSTLTVTDAVLDGNTAKEYGGAYYQYSGTSSFKNVTCNNNSAEKTGGGFCLNGGSSEIEDCYFEGNFGKGGGGAIMSVAAVTGHIRDCTFVGNSCGDTSKEKSEAYGGAVNLSGLMLAGRNVFKNNYSTGYGGALSLGSRVPVSNCVFEGNVASIRGGAIMAGKSCKVLIVKDCEFINNVAKNGPLSVSGQAGGGGAINSNVMTYIYGGKFEGNRANNHGGGAIEVNSADLNIDGTQFLNNVNEFEFRAGACGGGAILFDNGSTKTKLLHNCNIRNSYFEGNETTGYGGGVNVRHGQVLLENNEFNDNKSLYGGGYCCGFYSNDVIINNTFTRNQCEKMGGGYLAQANCTVDMSGCTFTENVSGTGGGGLCIYNVAGANVRNITAYGNTANTSGAGMYLLSRYEGGTLDNVKMYRNNANNYAGAIYVAGEWTVKNSDIHDNTSNKGGGAFSTAEAAELTVEGGRIYRNSTGGSGGAIASVGYVTVKDTLIEDNTAKGDGGAISNRGATSYYTYTKLLDGTVVRNNTCDGNGGALYTFRTFNVAELDGAEVYGNKAKLDGGAFYQYEETTINVLRGKIYDNECGGCGGAIYGQGEVNLLGGEIYRNFAANTAGGVYLSDLADDGESLQHNVFTFGAIRVYDNSAGKAADVYMTDTAAALVQNSVLLGGADFNVTVGGGRKITKTILGAYNYQDLGNDTYRITDATNALRPTVVDAFGVAHPVGEVVTPNIAELNEENKESDKMIDGNPDDGVEEEEADQNEDLNNQLGETDILSFSALDISLAATALLIRSLFA